LQVNLTCYDELQRVLFLLLRSDVTRCWGGVVTTLFKANLIKKIFRLDYSTNSRKIVSEDNVHF